MQLKFIFLVFLFCISTTSVFADPANSNPLLSKSYWKISSTLHEMKDSDGKTVQTTCEQNLNFAVVRADPLPTGGKVVHFYAGFCVSGETGTYEFFDGNIYSLDGFDHRTSNTPIGHYTSNSIDYAVTSSIDSRFKYNMRILFQSNTQFNFVFKTFSPTQETVDEGNVAFISQMIPNGSTACLLRIYESSQQKKALKKIASDKNYTVTSAFAEYGLSFGSDCSIDVCVASAALTRLSDQSVLWRARTKVEIPLGPRIFPIEQIAAHRIKKRMRKELPSYCP